MANTRIWVYDSFSDADHARDELLSAGFASSSVHLSVTEDEAGPVEGNFTVGNKVADTGGISGFFKSLVGGEEHTYQHDYGKAVQRGSYLLAVDADDESQLVRASEISRRFGAIDIGERTPDRR